MSLQCRIDGHIGRIALDRPPLNILTRALLADLRRVLGEWENSPGLRVVLLSATGAHFSAGADVGEHLPPTCTELIPEFVDTIDGLVRFPLPIVAAVRGRCLGGGFELAQAADVVVAGEGATFGQPEIALGVTAPAACAVLPRRGFAGAAAELLLTGDAMTAERARAAGFVERVVPDDQVDAEALALADRMARHSAAALRATKASILLARGVGLSDALRHTARFYVEDLMRTEDAAEGLAAFLGKRTPEWKDR
jgi:cyclohexa-1,5-dienecarbonyl-CoA hydratase